MMFIKKMGSYLIGSVFCSLISFLFLPLYTAKFTVSDYGIYDLSLTTNMVLISFIMMEIWTALLRFAIDSKNTENEKLISNIILLVSFLVIPYVILYLIISKKYLFHNNFMFIILGLLMLFQNIYQFYLRAINETKIYILSGVFITIIQVIFNLIFILLFNYGIISLVYSQIISRFIVLVIIEIKVKFLRKFKFKYFDFELVKKIICFAFPFSINAIALWGMTNINRFFAASYLGNEANGYIAIATKFSMIISLVSSVFILSWQESAFMLSDNKDKSAIYSNMFDYLILYGGIFTFILMPLTCLIFPYMIDHSYSYSLFLIPFYYCASFTSVVNGFFGQIFGAEKKTHILTYSTFIGAFFNIVSLIILLPKMNMLAIPISLIIGTFMNSIIRYLLIKKMLLFEINIINLFSISFLIITGIILMINVNLIKYIYLYFLIFLLLCLLVNNKFVKNIIYDLDKNIVKYKNSGRFDR